MPRCCLPVLLATAAALAGVADAQGVAERIEVAVGDTVERDVGIAVGVICDDLAVVRPDLVTRSPSHNAFLVTGLARGTTQCRVGSDPALPSRLFQIVVVPARARPPEARPRVYM